MKSWQVEGDDRVAIRWHRGGVRGVTSWLRSLCLSRTRRIRLICLVSLAAAVCVLEGHAWAHQYTRAQLEIDLGATPDDATVIVKLRGRRRIFAPLLAQALASNDQPTAAEIRAGRREILWAAATHLTLYDASSTLCTVRQRSLKVLLRDEVRVELRYHCPASFGRGAPIELRYDLFFATDPDHKVFVTLRGPTQSAASTSLTTLDATHRSLRFSRHLSLGTTLWRFFRLGVFHIFGGTDHILFLLALLLAAPLARRPGAGATTATSGDVSPGEGLSAALARRPGAGATMATSGDVSPGEGLSAALALESSWRPGLVYLLKIVSTFTVAHSLTLAASGLGWVHLPSKLVESVIAASILWVALENIVLPSSRYRVALVFVFGLAHGFGFADVLAETGLPPAALVGALLSFNVGVEVGQLMIVGLAFPMIILTARVWTLRGWSYPWLLRGGSAIVAVCGAYWLVTRLWS